MKKIIEKIRQWYCNWQNNMHEARVARLRKLAREYCKLSDLGGQPCVMIDGVPLFVVTDKATSLTDMASEMMSCYYQGFNDCWKFFTGEDLDLDN